MGGEHGEADPAHGSFVSAVVKRIVSAKIGNVHSECMEHNIAMLCPSLLQAGRPTADRETMRSVESRLRLELGTRTTAELRVDDAPPAIWLPRDNPELQIRLREAERATQDALRETAACRATARELHAANALRTRPAAAPKVTLAGEILQRTVTKLLRHTAVRMGLAVRADGYVQVERILSLDQFYGVSMHDLLAVVAIDSKRRFNLADEEGVLFMRANQGHSMSCVKEEQLLSPILNAEEVPVCIHGTYEEAFHRIMEGDLNR